MVGELEEETANQKDHLHWPAAPVYKDLCQVSLENSCLRFSSLFTTSSAITPVPALIPSHLDLKQLPNCSPCISQRPFLPMLKHSSDHGNPLLKTFNSFLFIESPSSFTGAGISPSSMPGHFPYTQLCGMTLKTLSSPLLTLFLTSSCQNVIYVEGKAYICF